MSLWQNVDVDADTVTANPHNHTIPVPEPKQSNQLEAAAPRNAKIPHKLKRCKPVRQKVNSRNKDWHRTTLTDVV